MKTEKISNGLKNLIALARKIDRKKKAGRYGKPMKIDLKKDTSSIVTKIATDLAEIAGTSFNAAANALVITCLKMHLKEIQSAKPKQAA